MFAKITRRDVLKDRRNNRRHPGPRRPRVSLAAQPRLGRRGEARAERRAAAAGDRAARAAARRDAARPAAGRSRRPDSQGTELSRGAGRAAAGRRAERRAAAVASASSSTPCWWSTRPTWPASRRPPSTAGCRSSGRSTTSRAPQAQDVKERGDWTMSAVDESAVPPAHKAQDAFIAAMDNWDEPAADAAVAGLARTAGANEIFELFFRYGMRDFRDDRPQGDLRRQQLADAAMHRLAARRAGAAVAGLRAACRTKATTRPSATTRPTGRSAATTSWPRRFAPTGKTASSDKAATTETARDAAHGVERRRLRARSSSCSTAASRRNRSGTRCSSRPASC